MKRFVLVVLVVIFTAANFAFADSPELKNVEFWFGKSTLFTGSDLFSQFSHGKNVIKMQGNDTRVNTRYLWGCPYSFFSGISGGFFYNTPWLGPEIVFSPNQYISTLHWFGWYAGKLRNPSIKGVNFFFGLNAIYFSFKQFSLSYTLWHFEDDKPNHLPGISFNKKVNKLFAWSVGCEFDTNANEKMFNMTLKYNYK